MLPDTPSLRTLLLAQDWNLATEEYFYATKFLIYIIVFWGITYLEPKILKVFSNANSSLYPTILIYGSYGSVLTEHVDQPCET